MPNLHAALVHFPIAWLVAALLFDIACVVLRRWLWLDRAAVSLYVLAVVATGSAIWAGQRAAGQVGVVSAEVARLIGEHGDWAFLTLLFAIGTMLLRFEVAWSDRGQPVLRFTRARLLALVLAFGCQWVLAETAARGGRLVFQHGVAVSP